MFGLANFYISPVYLGFYRLLYCVIIATFLGLPAYTWIGYAPDYLFFPPPISISNFFEGFPAPGILMVVTIVNLIFFTMMFLGIWSKWTSILFSLSALIGHSFFYSFGKVDHLLLWLVAPVFMAFAGWGDYFSVDQVTNKRQGIELRTSADSNSFWILLLAFTIAFSMFTAGIQKIWGGWLHWETDPSRYHVLRNYFSMNKDKLLATYLLDIDNQAFWKVQDYATLVLEIGFIFSMFRVSTFRIFLAFATFFHIMVLLMLNIPFFSNPIVYLVFLDWKSLDANQRITKWALKFEEDRRVLPFFFVVPLAIFGYWLSISLIFPKVLVLPGLTEMLLAANGFTNGGDLAMYWFFLAVFLVLLYVVIRFFRDRYLARQHGLV